MNPPRVFISYSHDSAEHKLWVLDFATTLRNRGVDAVLDQWDLLPGDDLPHFMETQLAQCDNVLMICTDKYVAKANAGEGGVGYEKMIMTSSMLSSIDKNKVIPIIRQQGTDHRPTFLNTKLYINFSNDSENEYRLDDVLRTLLNAPLYEKPAIGLNPFTPMEGSRPDKTADGIKEVMIAIARAYQKSHSQYVHLSSLVRLTTMHRLALSRYLNGAIELNLIYRYNDENFSITDAGVNYLELHSIIDF
jgi:hypothetical protein